MLTDTIVAEPLLGNHGFLIGCETKLHRKELRSGPVKLVESS